MSLTDHTSFIIWRQGELSLATVIRDVGNKTAMGNKRLQGNGEECHGSSRDHTYLYTREHKAFD